MQSVMTYLSIWKLVAPAGLAGLKARQVAGVDEQLQQGRVVAAGLIPTGVDLVSVHELTSCQTIEEASLCGSRHKKGFRTGETVNLIRCEGRGVATPGR